MDNQPALPWAVLDHRGRWPFAFRSDIGDLAGGAASTTPDKWGAWDDRGTTRTDGYLPANQQAEAGERFDAFATLFDPTTFRHIEGSGIGSGWCCWEVGAGGTSVVSWLAKKVGRPERSWRPTSTPHG